MLGVFGDDRQKAVSEYQRFVAAGKHASSPWQDLKNQIYLGSERFVEQMQARIGTGRRLKEIPRKQRLPIAKPLEYYGQRYRQRDRALAEAYLSGAYTMQQIGAYFGIGRMTVNRVVKNYELSGAE